MIGFLFMIFFIIIIILLLFFFIQRPIRSDYQPSPEKNDKIVDMPVIKISSNLELPYVHFLGFEVKKVPSDVFLKVQEVYKKLLPTIKKEKDIDVLKNIYNKHCSDIITLDALPDVRDDILENLRPFHEQWSNRKLINSVCYGIRSYNKGTTLGTHIDRFKTHHISSIIIVDKKINRDWPLDIKDHTGNWHKIYANIGDMIMYESATCEHGRTEPFDGEYFRNMFVHYKFKNIIF